MSVLQNEIECPCMSLSACGVLLRDYVKHGSEEWRYRRRICRSGPVLCLLYCLRLLLHEGALGFIATQPRCELSPSLRLPLASSVMRHAGMTFVEKVVPVTVPAETVETVEDKQRFLEAGYEAKSAVYGYIPRESVRTVLLEAVRKITRQTSLDRFIENEIFVDIGSGDGGVVFNVLDECHSLRRGVGIEFCGSRHASALESLATADKSVQERAEFIEGDACDGENPLVVRALETARVIFVSNVMFDEALQERLSGSLRRFVARRGKAVVIVAHGKKLDLGDLPSAFDSGLMAGNWGLAPLYVYGLLPQ